MQIDTLFEDEHIIIVNKPPNILIHNSYYARNIKDKTLLDVLLGQYGTAFYPVHRLDRKTSGVLVLSKQKEDVSVFQALFNNNQIQKSYLGIVRGFMNESITIDTPVKNPDTQQYKDANTVCEPIDTALVNIPVHPYETARYSLVKLKPTTGRMHQLRIHMNKISRPIIGDYKYGDRFHNRMFENEFKCKNLFLHAYSLEFKHPFTNKNIVINATLPGDWAIIFDKFGWKIPAIHS